MGSPVKPDYVLKPLPDDGTRGYRMELDEFMADNDLVNIFLLALSEMQKRSLEKVNGKMNLFNYYALGAIHGSPREDWNNYPNNPKDNGNESDYGYCHHGLDTFPTWHRPYMMMYERAVYEEMLKQADKYTDATYKARYHAAAQRFRLPYFDPIMPRYEFKGRVEDVWGVPRIMRTNDVWIRKPNDPQKLEQISNPLYTFRFPAESDWKDSGRKKLEISSPPFNSLKTIRTPTAKGETNDQELEKNFKAQGVNLAGSLWQMLSPDFKDIYGAEINADRPWSSFANHNARDSQEREVFVKSKGLVAVKTISTVSIESWHDGIHDLIGQGNFGYVGQMSDPTVAGFDPIFWMHHNNIDRLLSLHQAIYGQKPGATQRMREEAANLQLKPFAKDADGTCWKSSDPFVADYFSPGFAVPGDKRSDPGAIRESVKQYITDTYFWATNKAKDKTIFKFWPKPMQYSEALNGTKAERDERGTKAEKDGRETIKFTAIDAPSGTLVHRNIRISAKKLVFDDQPIELQSTLNDVAAISSEVPEDMYWTPEQQEAAITESWNAHIRVRKFAFDGSFAVHVFVGHVKDDQTERYYTKKNEVGFSGIFASSAEAAESCSSCKKNREEDLIFEDVVPLTTQLTDYLVSNPGSRGLIRDGEHKTLDSLEPEHVVPFLKEQLQWRMVRINGELLSGQEQSAQLEVTISSRDYKAPTSEDIMGSYGPPTIYPEITNNKAGGLGYVYL